MKWSMVAISAALLATASGMPYEDSLEAVFNNRIEANDGSNGTAWFNVTKYGWTDYDSFLFGDDHGIYSYTSFRYLQHIADLGREAGNRENYGDMVLLLYKFLYGGEHDATEPVTTSDMFHDMVRELRSSKKDDNNEFIDMLEETATIDELKSLYSEVKRTEPPTKAKKKQSDDPCGDSHKANRNACTNLLTSMKNDTSWAYGGTRVIHYDGCFLEWNKDTTFEAEDVQHLADYCYTICGGTKISCKFKAMRKTTKKEGDNQKLATNSTHLSHEEYFGHTEL